MNNTNAYYRLEALCAKLHETNSLKDEFKERQTINIGNLQEQLAKSKEELDKFKENPEEDLVHKVEENDKVALLEEEIQNLKESYQETKEKIEFEFYSLKKTILESLKEVGQSKG